MGEIISLKAENETDDTIITAYLTHRGSMLFPVSNTLNHSVLSHWWLDNCSDADMPTYILCRLYLAGIGLK